MTMAERIEIRRSRKLAQEVLKKEMMSPLALIIRRGRAAGRHLMHHAPENSGRGIPWKKLDPRKSLVLALFLLLPISAKADCVWIPVCMPYKQPPAEALKIYGDGTLIREIRPMWAASGGRTNFWVCGGSTNRLTASIVRGGVEEPMAFADPATVNDTDCTFTGPEAAPPTLRQFYGPKEQALRAIQQLYVMNNPKPIDTDQDGTIRANDMQLIWNTILGLMPDYTDAICTSGDCR